MRPFFSRSTDARGTSVEASDLFSPDLPLAVQVELTSRCNLRCRMCPLTTGTTASSQTPGPMSEVLFDELLGIARRCRLVVIAGYGEPLADRRCLPLLRGLDAEGIDIGLATNGLTVTPALARELGSMEHLRHVNVSIDSPDPECYREIRGADVKRALGGVANLVAAFKEPERITVSSVVFRRNLPTLIDFPAILASLGVRRYLLQGVLDYNEWASDQSLLAAESAAQMFDAIEASCRTQGVDLEFTTDERSHADGRDPNHARRRFYGSGPWDDRVTRECTVPWETPYVDKDGRVFPCCIAGAANENEFGRLGTQTFDEIWHDERARQFRRDLLDGSTTPPICRRCTVVPLGVHPFSLWRATLIPGSVTITGGARPSVEVVLRNDGARTWTRDDCVRVGTYAPRDGISPLQHPNWLSPSRPATFLQESVKPRELATFVFEVTAAPERSTTGSFKVVVDGVCWLPNTQFTVTVGDARRSLNGGLRAGLRRRLREVL